MGNANSLYGNKIQQLNTSQLNATCSASGYTGNTGFCTCDNGYGGTVTYSTGGIISGGCTKCQTGYWAQAGNNNTCAPISCSATGYTGSSGSCISASGFYSSGITYNNGILGGSSQCNIGSISNQNSTTCSVCPAGTYVNLTGIVNPSQLTNIIPITCTTILTNQNILALGPSPASVSLATTQISDISQNFSFSTSSGPTGTAYSYTKTNTYTPVSGLISSSGGSWYPIISDTSKGMTAVFQYTFTTPVVISNLAFKQYGSTTFDATYVSVTMSTFTNGLYVLTKLLPITSLTTNTTILQTFPLLSSTIVNSNSSILVVINKISPNQMIPQQIYFTSGASTSTTNLYVSSLLSNNVLTGWTTLMSSSVSIINMTTLSNGMIVGVGSNYFLYTLTSSSSTNINLIWSNPATLVYTIPLGENGTIIMTWLGVNQTIGSYQYPINGTPIYNQTSFTNTYNGINAAMMFSISGNNIYASTNVFGGMPTNITIIPTNLSSTSKIGTLVWTQIPLSNAVIAVTALANGTVVGIGMNNALCSCTITSYNTFTSWVSIPNSGSVVEIATLNDGITILGLGTNNQLYLTSLANIGTTYWTNIPNTSGYSFGNMSVMSNGKIIVVPGTISTSSGYTMINANNTNTAMTVTLLTSSNVCTSTPSGNYSNTSSYTTIQCPAGYYCPAGSSSGTTNICPAGQYCPVGSSSGTPCPAGYYCPAGSSSGTTNICPAGSYCPVGSSSGTPCPAGSYCPVGSSSGIPCPAGYYCPAGSSSGTTNVCPAGSYCTAGSSSGTPCPAGYYCPAGSSIGTSSQCPAGYYCPVGTSSGTSYQCPAGYYCPVGSSSGTTNICPAGYYCPAGSSIGTTNPCPAGYYCPSGSYSGTTNPCAPGSISTGTASSCSLCPAGYFTSLNNSAQTSCIPAAPGYAVTGTGSSQSGPNSKVIACGPGTYQGSQGQSSCIATSAGYYASGGANSVQTACPAGTYQGSTGQGSCNAASAGYYASGTGNAGQTACPPGQYQGSTGQAGCNSCMGYAGTNMWASNAGPGNGGSTSCNYCPWGADGGCSCISISF